MQDQDKLARIVRAVADIDAAITARHHIAVREIFDDGTEHLSRFAVDPTLAGLERLSRRLTGRVVRGEALSQPVAGAAGERIASRSIIWWAQALSTARPRRPLTCCERFCRA